jgi:DNA repair protein RadB
MILDSHNIIKKVSGDLQKDTITTIFGPPGCGKSTICFELANQTLEHNKKVIYIDTEGGFSPERLQQINPQIELENIIVFSPKSFEEQNKLIKNLSSQIKSANQVGLVIIDSLVMLYRLKLGDAPQKINMELGEQLRMLTEISRTFHIPIFVTNQMYTSFDTKENKMVGGMVIEYWSKTIIEMDKEGHDKKILLKKHKFKGEGNPILYEITNLGIQENKSRGFSFFKN